VDSQGVTCGYGDFEAGRCGAEVTDDVRVGILVGGDEAISVTSVSTASTRRILRVEARTEDRLASTKRLLRVEAFHIDMTGCTPYSWAVVRV